MSDSEKKNDLFKSDRRKEERPESPDRRVFLRASPKLMWKGILAAALVAAVLFAIVYFRS